MLLALFIFIQAFGAKSDLSLLQRAQSDEPVHTELLDEDGLRGFIKVYENGTWVPLPQVRRTQYFTYAFEKMPLILEHLNRNESFIKNLSESELHMLQQIDDYLKIKKIRLQFSYNQAYFQLNTNETVRTASTTPEIDSDIFINKLIIDDPLNEINFSDALRLLIHELGHKIKKSSQSELDLLANKIKNTFENEIESKSLIGLGKMTLVKNPFLIFVENSDEVIELSEQLMKTLNLKQQMIKPGMMYSSYSNEQKKVIRQTSILEAQTYLGPLNHTILRLKSNYSAHFASNQLASEFIDALQFSSLATENDVLITSNPKSPFKLLSSKKLYQVEDQIIIGSISAQWLDHNRIEISAQIPKVLNTEFPDLLIENGKISFRLKIQSLDEKGNAKWLLNTENGAQDSEFLAQAVVTKAGKIIFSENGILLKLLGDQQLQSKLRLKSIQVQNTEPEMNEKGPAQAFIKLRFKSRTPIKEVRLAFTKEWASYAKYQVTEPHFFSSNLQNGYPRSESPLAYKDGIDFMIFDETDFTQKKVGPYYEVEITKEEYLEHISIFAGQYTQHISWAYTNTQTAKKYFGIDEGHRKISHIEAVNTSLEQVSTKWRTSVKYRIYEQRFCRELIQRQEAFQRNLKNSY